jgi:dTDP-4-amino-4,6-dideoxygalactose transaminase
MKKIYQIEPSLGNEEKKELIDVIDSGWFTESKKTKEFERRFAEFTKCKYACAITSGTVGLYLGLLAMNIKKNDQVIVPDLTFVASPNAIEGMGAKPVLCDIEKDTLNLDLEKIEKKITKKTKAIIPLHYSGILCDQKRVYEIAKKHNLRIIEDCCHAFGTEMNGKKIGSYGDMAVFSFDPIKTITSVDGGCLVIFQDLFCY